MLYRVAVASTDGIIINQHFGHTELFHIIELNTDTLDYQFIEDGYLIEQRIAEYDFGSGTPLILGSSWEKDVVDEINGILVDVHEKPVRSHRSRHRSDVRVHDREIKTVYKAHLQKVAVDKFAVRKSERDI